LWFRFNWLLLYISGQTISHHPKQVYSIKKSRRTIFWCRGDRFSIFERSNNSQIILGKKYKLWRSRMEACITESPNSSPTVQPSQHVIMQACPFHEFPTKFMVIYSRLWCKTIEAKLNENEVSNRLWCWIVTN
jgi:hypothetical protein